MRFSECRSVKIRVLSSRHKNKGFPISVKLEFSRTMDEVRKWFRRVTDDELLVNVLCDIHIFHAFAIHVQP